MPKVLIFDRSGETDIVRGDLVVGKDSCDVEIGEEPLQGGPFRVIFTTSAGSEDTSTVAVSANARLSARCTATANKTRCHWAYRIHGF